MIYFGEVSVRSGIEHLSVKKTQGLKCSNNVSSHQNIGTEEQIIILCFVIKMLKPRKALFLLSMRMPPRD